MGVTIWVKRLQLYSIDPDKSCYQYIYYPKMLYDNLSIESEKCTFVKDKLIKHTNVMKEWATRVITHEYKLWFYGVMINLFPP